ncbi:pep-cterm domain protein [Gigaspora margarita]|uniref:Pep-cterm domain protein n=1 Tax=Gigaspora margarita TaxID=4874 RepID=A0A8H4AFK1_GIGMA|nr:pep-cterm domain protein [Gigaspora margarita]
MASQSSKWSLSNDFSAIQNPSSVWSYGYREVVTGTFFLLTHLDKDPKGTGIVAWFPVNATWNTNWLGVYYNPNPTAALLVYNSNMTYTAHGVGMHPHSNVGTPSVVRFTAPKDGSYALSLTATHVDDHATNSRTGLYIIHNNLETLWEGEIFGIGASKSYNSPDGGSNIKTNETIDFIVGQGLTGNVNDNINFATTLVTIDINLLTNDATNKQQNSTNQSSQSQQSNDKVSIIALGTTLGFTILAIIIYFFIDITRTECI